uniref:Uncharacterized protein n=1 Tax=Lepeophtheirus salmonis TaxID=72036 RepID=A0A0K2T3F4_LEPSM
MFSSKWTIGIVFNRRSEMLTIPWTVTISDQGLILLSRFTTRTDYGGSLIYQICT